MSRFANKYGNVKATLDGIRFDSRAEMHRYQELKALEAGGVIADLKVHPLFVLEPSVKVGAKRCRAITYSPDFTYRENGRFTAEDVKGIETTAFRLKANLFARRYPEYELKVVKVDRGHNGGSRRG